MILLICLLIKALKRKTARRTERNCFGKKRGEVAASLASMAPMGKLFPFHLYPKRNGTEVIKNLTKVYTQFHFIYFSPFFSLFFYVSVTLFLLFVRVYLPFCESVYLFVSVSFFLCLTIRMSIFSLIFFLFLCFSLSLPLFLYI